MNEAIGESYLGDKDLVRVCPPHYINIYEQGRHDHIGAVFAEVVEVDALGQGKAAELFVIIPQQLQAQGFAFLAFGKGKDLIDISPGTNGRDMVVTACFFSDEFTHLVPVFFGHLVF